MYKNYFVAITSLSLLAGSSYAEDTQTKKNIAVVVTHTKKKSSEQQKDVAQKKLVIQNNGEVEPIIIQDEQGNLRIELYNNVTVTQTITINANTETCEVSVTDEEENLTVK